MKHKLIILLSVFSLLSCNAEENNEVPTSMKDITISNFPVIDGSDSTAPLRYILMCKLLGFGYEWQASPFIQNPDEAPKQVVPIFTCSECHDGVWIIRDCHRLSCPRRVTAVRSDIDKSSMAYRLFEFLTTEEGQAIVDESGYVSLQTASTGIRDVAPSGKDAPVYNLSGQRLKAPNKGINIIGNKKLLVKPF